LNFERQSEVSRPLGGALFL